MGPRAMLKYLQAFELREGMEYGKSLQMEEMDRIGMGSSKESKNREAQLCLER